MTTFDVRSAKTGITARIVAPDELDAMDQAATAGLLDDEDEGIIEPSHPVGWDGGDAEDAIAEGEAYDAGDHV